MLPVCDVLERSGALFLRVRCEEAGLVDLETGWLGELLCSCPEKLKLRVLWRIGSKRLNDLTKSSSLP